MKEDAQRELSETSGTSGKRKSWLKILLFFLCVSLAVSGWYFVQHASKPVEGTIKIGFSNTETQGVEAPPALILRQKQHFTLMLPESYQNKERETSIGEGVTLREQAYFSDSAGSLRKVAVTIDERAHITPQDLTSYIYRKSHPETYREKILEWRGQNITAFEKNESVYEILAYIPKENHFIASVALISASETPEELIKDFSDILMLFEWTH